MRLLLFAALILGFLACEKSTDCDCAGEPTPLPIVLQGSGNQATSKFVLEAGLRIIRVEKSEESFLIVELLDGTTGERIDFLLNELPGESVVSTAFRIETTGEYLLNIDNVRGAWTITIE